MKTNIAAFAAEYLFFAAVASPWEVSEEAFTAICAMASDSRGLGNEDRENCLAFMLIAIEAAAEVDQRAASPGAIYKATCEAVKRRGGKVYPHATPAR